MFDFITGEKFAGIADFIFTPEIVASDDYYKYPSTFNIGRLKDRNIVYTHTMYVKSLFKVIEDIQKDFIIISHNSDVNVDESFKLPANVLKWYTTNVAVNDKRIESIPIGLENIRWFPKLNKKNIMLQILGRQKQYRNLVYMNHYVKTNVKKRQSVYDLEKYSWITTDRGINGKYFFNYILNVYNHKYMICPEGNGMDTHRFWECLYMGTTPVVVKSINNKFYNDMPVMYVSDWSELSENVLDCYWNAYFSNAWKKEFDRDKLTFEYWRNKILK